ncbi:protein phosphatase 1 regulatory subunit 37 isoform X2 [Patella vulgata]|uniref:protein phosphatase 1 regulatory subunit 37 isoform X2 n=1 Tax=Patella vulgata TaxID=6465 RepID=UPI0024A81FBD|nr:protein phosphatase 1 regulatory subunit 37 isoform X2 [Patella vulgata]
MTMTEPSPQIAEDQIDCKTVNGVNNCETFGQEVNNVDLPLESGGVSSGSEQLEDCQDDNITSQAQDSETKTEKKGKGKSVKFPDGGFVAGYNEPKDPWKNAENWTTDELVTAYRKSCEKHGTKPLPKLVQQLQKITCTGKRHDSLILKGEKLDQKHCECLEEIFRRVQFRLVDLESSHLDDECAVALFDMIEFYCSACQLNISFNKNISMRGWQSCSRLIRRTPSLTFLDMRNCDLNERSIPIMGRALKLGSHLTILHLENIYLSGRPLVILVAALKMNENLLELFLADNKLMPSDGIQLGILMKYNHKLELLDLRNNHLQDVGTRHLSDGLAEQTAGLMTLVLWNNQITYQGMPSLANALMFVQNLETLNLGHNSITNEGIHQLKEGLLKNKSLLRLGLQGTKVTCEGAVALAEYVADSSKLLRLDLRENDIKTAGLMGLSLALSVNETVTRIDLDKDTKKESGVKDYADQQRRLQQEIIWYQERNQVRALEREEEERRKLEERAQQEADLRKAAEALKEAQLEDQAMAYIPSMDKIQRPKLLFSNDQTPQQTLESPIVNDAQTTPEKNRVAGHSQGMDSPCFLSPPPADLLLSPQYCPDLTAKKIFTVSRVTDSTVIKGGIQTVDSPGACVDISKSLDEPHLLVSPGTLCQNMASETMNDYIEQIVSEASKEDDDCDSGESDANGTIDTNSTIECDSESDKPQLCSNDSTKLETEDIKPNFIPLAVSPSDARNDFSEPVIDSGSSNVKSGNKLDPLGVLNLDSKLCDSDLLTIANANSEVISEPQDNVNLSDVKYNSENVKPIELSDSIVAELSTLPYEEINPPSFDMLNSLENTKFSDSVTNYAKDNNLNFEKSIEKLVENEEMGESSSAITMNTANELNLPSNVKSSENMDSLTGPDQWLKIDSLDLVQQNKLKTVFDTNKPDFHTNLTMNGLTEELASALDISEEPSDSIMANLSSPDVFEQELDDMLAKFKDDINVWPFNVNSK